MPKAHGLAVIKRVFLAVLGGLAAVLAGILWWPQTIGGRIVDGVSGEPIEGVRVATTGIVYRPLAPLIALGWGNATSSISRVGRTDPEGHFDATFLAGIRLKHALLFMTKRGFVIGPAIEGGSGHASLHAEDFVSRPAFSAWPVSSATEMETGGAIGNVPADGREHQVQFGRAHAFWIRAQARNRTSEQDPVPVSIHWVSGKIQETDSFALTVPQDGYLREWNGSIDCTRRELTPRYFATQFDGNLFGALSIEMQSLCFGISEISIRYRFAKETGVRALADEEELELASR